MLVDGGAGGGSHVIRAGETLRLSWRILVLLNTLLDRTQPGELTIMFYNQYLIEKNAVHKDVILQNLWERSFSLCFCNVPLCYV